MTGQEIQERLDAIVEDLQTTEKGKSVEILFRAEDNTTVTKTLSSDINGVVDAAQLASVQNFINTLKPIADKYETEYAPVRVTGEAFRTAREVHQHLIDAATAARNALSDALEADDAYQDAKSDYDQARTDPEYVAARLSYRTFNVPENYGNLSDARGKYIG